jgi:hypothetical protein
MRRAASWKGKSPSVMAGQYPVISQARHVYPAASRYLPRGQVRDLLPVLLFTLLVCPALYLGQRSPKVLAGRAGRHYLRKPGGQLEFWLVKEPSPPGSASGTYDPALRKPGRHRFPS